MPGGTQYHGVPLASQETLSPTFESMIVILCLKAIHPELPDFVMQNKGMLFTNATPNFCDIQRELCETMDTLLAQMEAQGNVQRLQALDGAENMRWLNTQKFRNSGKSSQFTKVPASRPGSLRQPSAACNKQSCDYCFALGKDEKIWSNHDKLKCFALFPEKRTPRTQARMLSVPVYTDETESWDLQEALRAVENQFYATNVNDDESPSSGSGDSISPQ